LIKLFLFLTYIFIHPHSDRLQHQHSSNTSSLESCSTKVLVYTMWVTNEKEAKLYRHHHIVFVLYVLQKKIWHITMSWSMMRAWIGGGVVSPYFSLRLEGKVQLVDKSCFLSLSLLNNFPFTADRARKVKSRYSDTCWELSMLFKKIVPFQKPQ